MNKDSLKKKKYPKIIKKIIKENTKNDFASIEDKNNLYDLVLLTMNTFYESIDETLVKSIFNQYLTKAYVIDTSVKIHIPSSKKLKIPEEYKRLYDQVKYLENLPQYEQRSDEWFAQRNDKITASDGATALGESKYEKPESLILKKCGEGPPFLDNKFVHHGKKYEEIATMIYEHIYNCKIREYGLLPHTTVDHLGASPDGIQSEYTLDGKFNPGIGTMLEIKCPLSRKIITKGPIDGNICPHYYFIQVLQQLECCDLDKCDFWQCNIVEYASREEYLADNEVQTRNTIEQDEEITVPKNILKGCVIQLLPKENINEFCLYKAKYIYPKTLDQTSEQYDQWCIDEISDLCQTDYEKYKDYVFDRILYWKLENSHNVAIARDHEWFKEKGPVYKAFWDRVIHYRNNKKDLEELVEEVNKKKKPVWKKRKPGLHTATEKICDQECLILD